MERKYGKWKIINNNHYLNFDPDWLLAFQGFYSHKTFYDYMLTDIRIIKNTYHKYNATVKSDVIP